MHMRYMYLYSIWYIYNYIYLTMRYKRFDYPNPIWKLESEFISGSDLNKDSLLESGF